MKYLITTIVSFFLLLHTASPLSLDVTLNAEGYIDNGMGVTYIVRNEIDILNKEIQECIDSNLGFHNFAIDQRQSKLDGDEIAHGIARCIILRHHLRSNVRNQFTLIQLIRELRDLYVEKINKNTETDTFVRNTTAVYIDSLQSVLKEVLHLREQIRSFEGAKTATPQEKALDLIMFLSNEANSMKETKSKFGLELKDLETVYQFFVTKYTYLQTQLEEIKTQILNNNTALGLEVATFKAEIIAHYLEVSGMLDHQGLLNSAYDAYSCLKADQGDRSGCIYPHGVSDHFESCTMPSAIFGEEGQFLTFNSLIQVAEENMCGGDNICVDRQSSDSWSSLVDTWIGNDEGVTDDRWICIDFGRIGNMQSSRTHLRSNNQNYAKEIAKWLKEQIDTNGNFDINAATITSEGTLKINLADIPAYHPLKKTLSSVFVDDDSSNTCDLDKCEPGNLDICCMGPQEIEFVFEKNKESVKIKYSNKVVEHNSERYNEAIIDLKNTIVQTAVNKGYARITESTTLVLVLDRLNVEGCSKKDEIESCRRKASNATDCTFTKHTDTVCDIPLYKTDDNNPSELIYDNNDLGNTVTIDLNTEFKVKSGCSQTDLDNSDSLEECKQKIKQKTFYESFALEHSFVFGHFKSGQHCRIYSCPTEGFTNNQDDTAGTAGTLIPMKKVSNRTITYQILNKGNSATNTLALPCPSNYPGTCSDCSDDWHAANASRASWTEAEHTASAGPLWGVCQSNSKRYQKSSDTLDHCTKTKSKPCQLVDVTGATFVKSTGHTPNKLTITWDNSTVTDYLSGKYLTIKFGNAYSNIINGTDTADLFVQDNDYNPIYLYRSDASGKDLGDYLARVCHKHKGNYGAYPVEVEENPQCVQNAYRERQLFGVTTECVVDPNDTFENDICLVNEFDTSVNQTEGEQFKDLIQIKLPYDGSNPYNGCGEGVSRTCYVCGDGHRNKDNTGDVTKQCEPCPVGTESGPFNDDNGRECVACDGTSKYQDEEGRASCKDVVKCVSGEYVIQSPSSTQNRVCQACPVGSVSSGQNQLSCTECDGFNEFQNKTGQEFCEPVSSCPEGQGVTATSTPNADTVCQPCVIGSTYSNEISKTAPCKDVNVCDPDTEEEFRVPTASLDRECQCAAGHYVNTATESCQPCPDGEYQPSANQDTTCPEIWSTCAAGSRVSQQPSNTQNRLCEPCASGSFTDTTNQDTCTTWAVCGADQYVLVEGSSTNNRECADKKEDGEECTANQECTSNDCSDGLCITSCTQDSQCTHLTDNYCNTEYGICFEKGNLTEPCGVSGVATDGACLSDYCDPESNTCQVACSPDNCHLCENQGECDVDAHKTYCVWELYKENECGTCSPDSTKDPNCQDNSTHFCTPCGESIAKFNDGVGCFENRECGSGTCYQGTCGIPCSVGCTASQYCGSDNYCKEKVGQDDSCSATIECLDNLFCDQRQATPTCNTCDNAYGDQWTIDGSCVVTGFQDDVSTLSYGSTSSTKYKSESSAQSACTNIGGCQGITHWAVNTGSNGCGSDYATFDSSSMCSTVGLLLFGTTEGGEDCYKGEYAFDNAADCVSESEMTCAYANDIHKSRYYGRQCSSSIICACQYWTIDDGSNDPETPIDDIPDAPISSKTIQSDQPFIRTSADPERCTDYVKTIPCGTCPSGSASECHEGDKCFSNLCTDCAPPRSVCENTEYCDIHLVIDGNEYGFCENKKIDGSICSTNDECEAGSCVQGFCGIDCTSNAGVCSSTEYCDIVCRDKKDEGGFCTETSQCSSGLYCDSNSCAAICADGAQEHSCNGDAECCTASDYECVDNQCKLKCSQNACGSCTTQTECDVAAHETYCAWELYNIDTCGTCPTPGAGSTLCQDTDTQFCTPCGELINKFGDGAGCFENRECANDFCDSGVCKSQPKVFTDIQAGGDTTCAIEEDTEDLYCWGSNSWGLLGDGQTISSKNSPSKVALSNVKQVSVGNGHACAVVGDSRQLFCWGKNNRGQLGDGTQTGFFDDEVANGPNEVTSTLLSNVKQVSAGDGFTCAIDNSEKLYCWGRNSYGTLGVSGSSSKTPVHVSTLSNVKEVVAGIEFACAIVGDSRKVYCWGNNDRGQLGIGNSETAQEYPQIGDIIISTPTEVTTVNQVATIDIGQGYGILVKTDGSAKGWGFTEYGKMCKNQVNGAAGSQSYNAKQYESPVSCDSPLLSGNTMVSAYNDFSCMLRSSSIYCFGTGEYGQMGTGNTYEYNNPSSNTVKYLSTGSDVSDATQIAVGNYHACMLKTDKKAYCWGANWNNQLGDGSTTNKLKAVAVS